MGTCSFASRHGFSMLAVLVILSLGAMPALAAVPAARLLDSAPPNDNFADAKIITALPYDDSVNSAAATIEQGEPDACERNRLGKGQDLSQPAR